MGSRAAFRSHGIQSSVGNADRRFLPTSPRVSGNRDGSQLWSVYFPAARAGAAWSGSLPQDFVYGLALGQFSYQLVEVAYLLHELIFSTGQALAIAVTFSSIACTTTSSRSLEPTSNMAASNVRVARRTSDLPGIAAEPQIPFSKEFTGSSNTVTTTTYLI